MDAPLAPFKQEAAERALAYVADGMVIGLGTGSTAAFFVQALGVRVQAGLRILGVPTSAQPKPPPANWASR